MYRGLPTITNQISDEEQRGIPHHLLATVDIDQPTWSNAVFAQEARKLICEIRSRGKLPIVVGGSHYYINSLLFNNSLIQPEGEDSELLSRMSQLEIEQQHPILSGPTDLMLKRLQEVDPVMGARWHPDDRRKIRRSLAIFLTTGRKASQIYHEQANAKNNASHADRPWHTLMFWVYANPEILRERLDKRIDKMERHGLVDEVRNMRQHVLSKEASGETVDQTRGIWQSIGFKQFEPLLIAENNGATVADLAKVKSESMELMKIATRQYARCQLRWLRGKMIPELRENGALGHLYLVDSSNASKFTDDVLRHAAIITQAYLEGSNRPEPKDISTTARDVLSAYTSTDLTSRPKYEVKLCDVCNLTTQTEEQWKKHVNGQRHKRGLKHKSRTSLMVIHRAEAIRQDEVCVMDAS